eukprot:gene51087-14593_t
MSSARRDACSTTPPARDASPQRTQPPPPWHGGSTAAAQYESLQADLRAKFDRVQREYEELERRLRCDYAARDAALREREDEQHRREQELRRTHDSVRQQCGFLGELEGRERGGAAPAAGAADRLRALADAGAARVAERAAELE